ncbi:MAG: hypothetical protein LBG87_04550 [Spirochaetaceae bacterium]|jgi:hypothetical protein|nr:hypothetical protein [Spirochaetaceae bacterium]
MKYLLGLLILALAGCGTSSSSTEKTEKPEKISGSATFWDTGSVEGSLIFHGGSPVYSKREDSVKAALEDAAKKAAVFATVEGRLRSSVNIGAGVFDYQSETETSLIYPEPSPADLVFDPETDVLESNHSIFVRARYKPPEPAPIPYRSSSFQKKAKPSWIADPPAVPGYTVGVGYAGARSIYADTLAASYENAVFSIIAVLYGSAKEETASFQGAGTFDVSSTKTHEIKASGKLRGFYVIDAWTDPADKSMWTLGIAQKAD